MRDANRFYPSLAAMIAALAPSAAAAECPDDYEYVLIADDTGPLALVDPDGYERSLPSIDNDGRVAFRAWTDGGAALMVGDGVRLDELARDRLADPDAVFARPGDPVLSGGTVAFRAWVGEPERPALFVILTGAEPELVAEADDDRFTFIDPRFDLRANGEVIFSAQAPGGSSLIASADSRGSVRVLVDQTSGLMGMHSPSMNNDGDLVFVATTFAGAAIHRNGALIAETDASTGLGLHEWPALSAGGTIAYLETYPSPSDPGSAWMRARRWSPSTSVADIVGDRAEGICAGSNESHISIVSRFPLAASGDPSRSTGCVVFDAHDIVLQSEAICIADEDGTVTVATEADELLGSLGTYFDVSSTAVNAYGQVAFYADLTGGRRAIVRADPISRGGPGPDPAVDGGMVSDPPAGLCSASGARSSMPLVVLLAFGVAMLALRRAKRSSVFVALLAAPWIQGCIECGCDPPRMVTEEDAGSPIDAGSPLDAPIDMDDAGPTARRCSGLAVRQASIRNVHGWHGCAVTEDARVFCWGSNANAELGLGTSDFESHPPAPFPGISDAVEVEASESFTCARLASGEVRCVGNNNVGQLGDGNAPASSTALVTANSSGAMSLDSGRWSVCARQDGRAPSCWGWDMYSRLTETRFRSSPVEETRLPLDPDELVLGEQDACALAGGRVSCIRTMGATLPFGPPNTPDYAGVGSGVRHFCAIRSADRSLVCWGQNFSGQLGDGTTSDALEGVSVAGLRDVVSVSGGWGHTCAALADGSVWCWGEGAQGQLGTGVIESEPVMTPRRVIDLEDVVELDASYASTCALTRAGDLFCWGHLDLGEGRVQLPSPQCVVLPP